MKEKKTTRRAGLLLVIVCIAALLVMEPVIEPAFAATHPFKSSTIYGSGTRTARFTCNGMTGLCCEAGAYSTYKGSASLSRLKNSHNAARCAYYYGYCKGWTSGANGVKLARLLSYCMGNGTGGDFKASTMKSLLKTAKKAVVPAGFECWLCKPKGSSKQDFIVWKCPKGRLKVVKKSADSSVTKLGKYSLGGMTIRVYSDAACKTCVKTLTTKKNGSTGGSFVLPVGTYYVKETAVPDQTGYELNSAVMKVAVTSGKTTSATVKNKPAVGSVQISKVTTGDGGMVSGFRFILTGKTSGKKYTLVTGPDGTAKVGGLPLGSYSLAEDLTDEQQKYYTDATGPQSLTLAKGKAAQDRVVKWNNVYEPQQRLKIVKRTGDGGPVSGFSFHVSWLLDDSRLITAEEIAAAANPQVDLAEGQTLGLWQIEDAAAVARINEDAKAGRCGTHEVVLRNTVTTELAGEAGEETAGAGEAAEARAADGVSDGAGPAAGVEEAGGDPGAAAGGEDAAPLITEDEKGTKTKEEEILVPVEITLVPSEEIAEGTAQGQERAIQAGMRKDLEFAGLRVSCNSLRFAGAATTGEETLVTGENGQIQTEHVLPGTYTITEQMTDRQKKRYRQPAPQTVVIGTDSEEVTVVTFVNEPIRIPVRLQKESADGRVGDVEFTLSGTPEHAEEPMEAITIRTDEQGLADLGLLYPGTYLLEESGYDRDAYANPYPMEGKEAPAIAFMITGDELTEEEIQEGQSLWIGGEEAKAGLSREKITFRNLPYVDLQLTKIDGITGSFLPGARFLLQDSEGKTAARFEIGEDGDGLPLPLMLQTNGIVTGAQAEQAAADGGEDTPTEKDAVDGGEGTPVMVGTAPGGTDYQYIVLHGLTCGELYKLTEEAAPEGFAPLEEPYLFTVSLDEKGQPVLNTCDEYGAGIATVDNNRGMLVVVNDAPEIGTVALDSETGEHLAEADESVLLTDNCTVSNLIPGQTYTLIARLMDITAYKKSGNVDDVRPVTDGATAGAGGTTGASGTAGADAEVRGRTVFQAENGENLIQVPMSLSAESLAGKTTVVYESLYQGKVDVSEADQKIAISEESDPNKSAQSITFPKIGTKAARVSGDVIEDVVSYQGLLPGRTYCIQGRLIDPESGEELESCTGETRFTAEKSRGRQTVRFPIDPAELAEQGVSDLVVFEKCFLVAGEKGSGGEEVLKQIASHEDLTDEDQTVSLSEPQTGDPAKGLWIALMAMTAALLAIFAVQVRRRKL